MQFPFAACVLCADDAPASEPVLLLLMANVALRFGLRAPASFQTYLGTCCSVCAAAARSVLLFVCSFMYVSKCMYVCTNERCLPHALKAPHVVNPWLSSLSLPLVPSG